FWPGGNGAHPRRGSGRPARPRVPERDRERMVSLGSNGFPLPGMAMSQRTWLDSYPADVPSSLPYPNIPVSGLLESAAHRYPERAACTLYHKAFSYREMADQARRLARSLADLGAGPGRTVGMLLPNIPDYLLALQAAWLTGATVLQLSPLMVPEELAKWT